MAANDLSMRNTCGTRHRSAVRRSKRAGRLPRSMAMNLFVLAASTWSLYETVAT